MSPTAYPTIRIAACDLNGRMRGKRVPGRALAGMDKGVRMPFSALNVDLWGHDIENSPLVFETGDADGVLVPTGRGPVPMPWLDRPSALVPMTMRHESGRPFAGDPRAALEAVLARYAARGWEVVAATEMEFTLVDDSGETMLPVIDPHSGRRLAHGAVLSIQELDAFDAFFSDLYDGCEDMGIPADNIIAEAGVGQFEVTLTHQTALRAADDAWLFKALVQGLARKYKMAATFMAKPYMDDAGNGMHVHFSVLDSEGRNIFSDGGPKGTDLLASAVAGCLAAMPDSTLIFAPFGNSYDRLVPGAHAPTAAVWAYENRTAAIRIPGGPPVARRIEHRSAGGDVNPYLLLATVLGAGLVGIEDELTPPEPISGNAYAIADAPALAADWTGAIDRLEQSALMRRILPPDLIDYLVMTKRQECAVFGEMDPEKHWESLIETA
ncbi:glutamine synthetase family protein [Marinibacterium sp. SX1]|uniref:glutamine synthetase family protein n=1 Tax=Marinibacterium sp. SX1 TaxID=3388424 RepID=UPI003D17F4AF